MAMDGSVWQDLQQLTATDWAVVGIATSVSLLGALLPVLGNLLGRLVVGEDPLLARWKVLAATRRDRIRLQRQARKEAKKAAKAARSQRGTALSAPPSQP